MAGKLLVAKASFACEVDGVEYLVRRGAFRVAPDHPVVKGRERLFEPAEAQATDATPKRARRSTRAKS
jgi:hypothetical protein